MAKFYGTVVYSYQRESAPGIWTEVVTERDYYGDVIRNNRRTEPSENLNDNIVLNNIISIISDSFACENVNSIKCVKWMGASWKVTNVEVQRPRLILTIGGVYNG